MAAPARAPGPADARIPCPLCGGLIHPIAGRCKHCKEDLTALRSARPAAAAALPALQGRGSGTSVHAPAPSNGHHVSTPYIAPAPASAHPANAHLAVPIAVANLHEGSQPILPPRPTGRMYTAKPSSSWMSWPVVVIVLAVIAILTAVVLMVWPPGAEKARAGTSPPPPAPERMDTNPLPPQAPSGGTQGSIDPWSPSPRAAPVPDIPDIDDPDLDPDSSGRGGTLRDPFSSIDPFAAPRPRRGGGLGSTDQAMMSAVLHRACDKLTRCPSPDPMLRSTCTSLATILPRQDPPTCAEARRCLDHIDGLSCASVDDTAALMELMTAFPDCTRAMSC